VSQPGWYPDPSGQPNQLRYWDGRAWTEQLTPAPGGDPSGGGGRRAWLVVLAAVVVIALVAVMVWRLNDQPEPSPVPTYSPTKSAWNETDEPTPSPSPTPSPTPTPTPTPSRQPSPRRTDLRCDRLGHAPAVDVTADSSRLTVGALSMPAPTSSGWTGPSRQRLIQYGIGAWGYLKVVEEHPDTGDWFNTLIIGPTNFDEPTDLETQARSIIACLATTDSLDKYRAPATLELKSRTISGRRAIQADATYSWDYPDLDSLGSRVRVVVVDTPDGPFFFFGEATKERQDVIAEMDRASAGLRAS
jgi:hypothetical protein